MKNKTDNKIKIIDSENLSIADFLKAQAKQHYEIYRAGMDASKQPDNKPANPCLYTWQL